MQPGVHPPLLHVIGGVVDAVAGTIVALLGPVHHPVAAEGAVRAGVVHPLYVVSLLFMPSQEGSAGVTPALPQSHSSPPVATPSPQAAPHCEMLVVKPLSVSWKFDSDRMAVALEYGDLVGVGGPQSPGPD